MARRIALSAAFVLSLAALSSTGTARADSGHFALQAGAVRLDAQEGSVFRPTLRAELAFKIVGPLSLGGFLQLTPLSLPAELPSLGGGLLVQLRPELPIFGWLIPIAGVEGSRVGLPTPDGRIDGWGLTAVGGLGFDVGRGVVLEGRVSHRWMFGLPVDAGIGDRAWTFTGGVTVRLPG